MRKRISFGAVVGVIFVGVFFYFTVISGIMDLNAKPASSGVEKQGQVVEYSVVYAKEVYELKHMLFGFIPTYSEHYYLTLSGDGLNSLLVRADEKWYSENFGSDGLAQTPVKVDGLVKSANNKKGLNLNSVNTQLGSAGHINSALFADANYVSEAVKKIFSGVLLFTAVVTIVLAVVFVVKGVLQKGGLGVNIMVVAAFLQIIGFIILMFVI